MLGIVIWTSPRQKKKMLKTNFAVRSGHPHHPHPLPPPRPGVILLLAAKSGDAAQAKNAIIQMQNLSNTTDNSDDNDNLDLPSSDEPATDARGHTPLHLAAIHNHAHIVSLLLTPFACPGGSGGLYAAAPSTECTTPGDRLTPLRLAAERGHLETVRVLLDFGASVTARDGLDQATPLHAAAEAGHAKVAVELVRHGADLEARAVSGQTPLRCVHVCVCWFFGRDGGNDGFLW